MNQQGSVGPISTGATVYDAAGEKVGKVRVYDAQAGYLDVEKGWLFPKDIYVPLSAVARSDADGVYLTMYMDDIQNQDWSAPLVDDAGTATMGTLGARAAGASADITDTAEVRVPIREEQLEVGKRQEEIGRVHLHKDVIEEQQTVSQPVTREQVRVERGIVQGDYTDVGPDAFTEQEIDVPVMGEELVTGKRTVVRDEVRLHKEQITEEQQVTDTIRKERVTVDGADVTDATTDTDTTYRQDRF